ncbi:MAG: glycosyl transferase [Candidatus Rokubacteria bacterium RBG_16_73_20]|nr:MAG: glycosyl transferase [Candidatus Rokubacteria bacterium GWA2_70_23]OGK78521.1 MAG: glycosyl transferase [Candidatus Rokubacteria bacterium GWC2_70_16]OGK94593.1 MAG: glycosyl transferase [Candidatus Rokubacteria bacterium RBG_16_73_20]HBH01294.1 glycosyltransferase [Candidatus Rokubacteria bacterium]
MSAGDLTPLSVILPVLNERDNLEPLHERLTEALEPMGRDWEVIYVDDGSTDGSWDVLRKLAAADERVRLVRLRKNFGQTPALAAGFAHARHPILVTLDADLQNDPQDIPRLVEQLGDSYDVVSGWRRDRNDPWLTRLLPSHAANFLIKKVSGVPLHDFGCTLKAYRREVVRDVSLYGEMHRFLPVLAAWVGGRVTEMEVTHHPRTRGVSKYGLLRTYKVLVDLITLKFIGDFQSRPNYIFGGFGLLSLMLGLLALDVVAYRVFLLRRFEATPLVFLMVLFFITGIFSLFIGFLAEIVIRGFHDTQRKPTYYVRETVGLDGKA